MERDILRMRTFINFDKGNIICVPWQMAESPAGAGVYLNDEDAKKLHQGIATINSAQFKVQSYYCAFVSCARTWD